MKKRTKGPYTAILGGASWARGPIATFATLRECRAYAESHGSTVDWCSIRDADGDKVAAYRRDTSKRGDRWFRAAI